MIIYSYIFTGQIQPTEAEIHSRKLRKSLTKVDVHMHTTLNHIITCRAHYTEQIDDTCMYSKAVRVFEGGDLYECNFF